MANVLCVSLLDNGGAMQQLTNALNKYTNHNARHLNFKKTWLNYDVDIYAPDYRDEELNELLKDRDFFIFSEEIPSRFKDLSFSLKRTNTIMRCYGTVARNNRDQYRKEWSKSLITFTGGGFDTTIHPYIGFVAYHIPSIYEFGDFPEIRKGNTIRICHATTKPGVKSTELVTKTLRKAESEFGIEPVIIQGRPWSESLRIKATCHITIDQFKLGGYGSSAVESMYLKNAVINRLSPFVRSMHPDVPIVQATEESMYDVLIKLLQNEDNIKAIGERGREYAMREHDAKTNISKWDYLIQWVQGGFQ